MGMVSAFVAVVAEYTVESIGRQLGYLFCYKKNVEDLKSQIVPLRDARDTLQRKVDEAIANGEEIKGAVNDLLKELRSITQVSENFKREEEQANTECSCGPRFPNLLQRHRLSRRATKMKPSVVAQIEKAENINEISYCPRRPITIANEGYVEFGTRGPILRDIIEALKDPNIGKVGVGGMGGLGKTMLAWEVAKISMDEEKFFFFSNRKEKLFTRVVFLTISQTPNLENIQRDILKGLGMDPSLQGSKDFEDRLRNRLSKEDKVLVIVDDVWDKFDLKGVGISFGDDKKGCKILVTSRYYHVLYNKMDVEKNFNVEKLEDDEAMSLFYRIVGDQDRDCQSLATKIVKECGGLPIAITTVASALKNKSIHDWKNALHDLRNSIPVNIDGVDEQVYTSIKLSYDFLRNKEAKSLLLLCSLFPEDADIDIEAELCNYGIGLNLFQGVNTLEDARNRTFTLVGNLKDHSLMLDGRNHLYVKLHDVIRDVVIHIASKSDDDHDQMHNFRNAAELEEYSATGMLKGSKAISLHDIKAPQPLESPELKLLRLIPTVDPWKIMQRYILPLDFDLFGGLNKLLVLDLQNASLRSIPTSSICLPSRNLQTLRLRHCNLGDISWIGELKNLKVLDLSFSNITELPTRIGDLNHLLSLKLRCCFSLAVIRPKVISRLTRLEELDLEQSFKNWEAEGVDNASVDEVKNLTNLTNLNLVAPDINVIINPKDMFSERLERFNIVLGFAHYAMQLSQPGSWRLWRSSKTLQLDLSKSRVLEEHDFKALVKTCESLYLRGLRSSVKSVAHELLDNRGFPDLKRLCFEDSAQIRSIADNYPVAFPSLERLHLYRLSNLENVINIHEEYQRRLITTSTPTEMTTTTFGKLSEIEVRNCDKLQSLFPLDHITLTQRLKEITVKQCRMMEEIITCRGNEGDIVIEISKLHLEDLPKLEQFIATTKSDKISDHSVMPLFSGLAKFPKLESLDLCGLNSPKIWNGELPMSRLCFQSLTTLNVRHCANLKGLIPSSMVGSGLVNLKTLEIGSCEAMEEIVFTEEYSAQDAKMSSSMGIKITFPKLEHLQLDCLSNLKRFCSGDCVDFSSLIKLTIRWCPKLGAFMTSSVPAAEIENEDAKNCADKQCLFDHKVELPKLQSISLCSLNVEKIWNDDRLTWSRFDFQCLRDLNVSSCRQLKGLIPSFMTANPGLVHLRSLRVSGCEAMKEIVFRNNFVEEGSSVNRISFPELETLKLEELPNLKRFCEGDYCVECPSLSTLAISGCGKLHLFKQKISLPTATNVHLQNENLEGSMEYIQHPSHHKDVTKIWNGVLPSSRLCFQSLTTLNVRTCANLKCLIPSSMVGSDLVNLKTLQIGSCEAMEEIVFTEEYSAQDAKTSWPMGIKITFPKLEHLQLNNLSNLKRFCAGDCVDFSSLIKLTIGGCPKLGAFITSSVPAAEIENEDARNCVDKQCLFDHKVELPKLQSISLCSLNVEKIWNDDRLTWSRFDFQCLRDLNVSSCRQLKGLIPSFMTANPGLVHLRSLRVSGCEAMKEIVFRNNFVEEGSSVNRISFPELETLQLEELPNLERFCEEDYRVECPSLSTLDISGCGKLQLFKRKISLPTATNVHLQNENLAGSMEYIQHPSHHKDVTKVDELSTETSSCQQTSVVEEDDHNDAFVFKATTSLRGAKLWNLHGQLVPGKSLQNVEILWIGHWDVTLKDLSMSLMSFGNLKVLRVEACHGLTTLFSLSAAKILSRQLTQLAIRGCNSLTQVVANYDDDHKEVHDDITITFSQLEILVLDDLCNLTSFYSAGNNLEFPRLHRLVVRKCPEMKTFSPHGIINCPSLTRIILCKTRPGDMYPAAWNGWNLMRNNPAAAASYNVSNGYFGDSVKLLNGEINSTFEKLWEDKKMNISSDFQHPMKRIYGMVEMNISSDSASKAPVLSIR